MTPELLSQNCTQPAATNDCICCQSVQQIGTTYYYSALNCSKGGCAFTFQSQNSNYTIIQGCTTCPPGFPWPPSRYALEPTRLHGVNEKAVHWYEDDHGLLYAIPDAHTNGMATLHDPTGFHLNTNDNVQGGPVAPALVRTWKKCHADILDVYIQLYHLQIPVYSAPGVLERRLDLYAGQEIARPSSGNLNPSQIHRQIDNYVQLAHTDGNLYHVLMKVA